MKITAVALASLVALAGTALAQTQRVEIADNVLVEALGADVDTIDDWNVFAADGTQIGDVEEVLGKDAQLPTDLAIDFEGQAGYDDRDVAIPIDRFMLRDGRLVLDAGPDEVKLLPAWDD